MLCLDEACLSSSAIRLTAALRAAVQALDVIQKGKRVASALSQSCAEFDSLEVRLLMPLQRAQAV